MDSTIENFTESEIAAENVVIDTENTVVETEDAENDVAVTEDTVVGTENSIDGMENTVDGGNGNPAGAMEGNLAGGAESTKNQEEGRNEEAGEKSSEKKWPGWPGESVFRILVPSHKVGGIIGRKGEFIKKICEESKARIKIIDAPQGSPERAVMVSAREEQDLSISPAMDGLLRVHKRIIDGLDGEARVPQNASNVTVTRLLAGATQTGTLIGKHGATIKSIQDASKCVVRVIDDIPPFALPDDKVVEIQGEPAGMHKALELIASHLRKFLVDRSVIPVFEFNMTRPPSQMQQNMPQAWGHPQRPPPNPSGSGFGGNPQFMPPKPHDNFYPPPDLPPFEKPPHYGISAFGRDAPPMGVHPSNNQRGQQVGNQLTQHMQVPISFADAVIGAAGANISYIRRASGATITIQETRGVPGEMTVEINGSATEVQTAQQLIQVISSCRIWIAPKHLCFVIIGTNVKLPCRKFDWKVLPLLSMWGILNLALSLIFEGDGEAEDCIPCLVLNGGLFWRMRLSLGPGVSLGPGLDVESLFFGTCFCLFDVSDYVVF